MAMASARMLVAPPTRVPLPYGLLNAAQPQEEADAHWANGVRFQPVPCGPAGVTLEPCPSVTGGPDLAATALGLPTNGTSPFTVYAWIDCSTVGYIQDAQRLATAALTSGEGRAVEREFWTGEYGTTPHLAEDTPVTGSDGVVEQTAATIVTGAALDPVEALGALEDALGWCYGNEGVVHVTPATLTHLMNRGIVYRDGARLRTPNGHLIAAGSGYPGTSPTGVAPAGGHAWMYATGAVTVRRSGIVLPSPQQMQVVNRNKNDVIQVAYRTYVIGWECCHFAALVRLGGEVTGSVGLPT
jgi:hypothetical protein